MNALQAKFAVLLLGLMIAGSATAGGNLWMGLKAGTLGLGLEAAWRPIPWLDVRAGGNMFDYDDNGSQAGINYDATLQLETYSATDPIIGAIFLAELEAERLQIETEFKDFKAFPVISLGFAYKF